MLFAPFGRFMKVLGGSLFQFALPLGLAIAFLKQRNPFGAVVCTWWAGENLIDVAPYIADARALQLVLLGGKTGAEVQGHDWEYILATLGWMRFDRTIGSVDASCRSPDDDRLASWGGVYLVRNRTAKNAGEPGGTLSAGGTMARSNVVFVGIKGSVLAIDRDTGETLWTTGLKGSEFVNVSLDGGDLVRRISRPAVSTRSFKRRYQMVQSAARPRLRTGERRRMRRRVPLPPPNSSVARRLPPPRRRLKTL